MHIINTISNRAIKYNLKLIPLRGKSMILLILDLITSIRCSLVAPIVIDMLLVVTVIIDVYRV